MVCHKRDLILAVYSFGHIKYILEKLIVRIGYLQYRDHERAPINKKCFAKVPYKVEYVEPLFIRHKYFGLCHLYKIISGPSSSYHLRHLSPPSVCEREHSVRKGNFFAISHTKCYEFFHLEYPRAMEQIWFRNTPNPNGNIQQHIHNELSPSHPLLNQPYNIMSGSSSVQLFCMHVGLSPVTVHSHGYNFITLVPYAMWHLKILSVIFSQMSDPANQRATLTNRVTDILNNINSLDTSLWFQN